MKTLWRLPSPSSGGVETRFEVRADGVGALTLAYPYDGDETVRTYTILFDDLASYRCTFHGAQTLEQLDSYDRLNDLGAADPPSSDDDDAADAWPASPGRRRYRLGVDEGPCYEIVAGAIKVVEEPRRNLMRALREFLADPIDWKARQVRAALVLLGAEEPPLLDLAASLARYMPEIGWPAITLDDLRTSAARALESLVRAGASEGGGD